VYILKLSACFQSKQLYFLNVDFIETEDIILFKKTLLYQY